MLDLISFVNIWMKNDFSFIDYIYKIKKANFQIYFGHFVTSQKETSAKTKSHKVIIQGWRSQLHCTKHNLQGVFLKMNQALIQVQIHIEMEHGTCDLIGTP